MRPICQALVRVSTPHNSLTGRFPAFGSAPHLADKTSSVISLKKDIKFVIPVMAGIRAGVCPSAQIMALSLPYGQQQRENQSDASIRISMR